MNKQDKLNIPYQVKSNFAGVKEINGDSRTISAVANTYNFFDYDYDVLRKGCAAKSIQERGAKSGAADKIVHALFHDLTRIVGVSKKEEETTIDGKDVLYVESYLPETTLGEDTLINYKAGVYDQHSIGFRYVQIEYIEKEAGDWDRYLVDIINADEVDSKGFFWNVTEINLHEYSTVAFGANKLTQYLGTKSQSKAAQYDSISKKLNELFRKANRQDIKDKKTFELQVKQLQQMIYELSQPEPSIKDTLKDQSRQAKDTQLFYNLINT